MDIIKQNKKYFSNLGLRYLIGTVLIFGVQIGLSALMAWRAPELYEKYAFLVMMLAMYLVAVPFMYFLIQRIPVKQEIPKNKIGVGSILGYFLVSYAGMYLSNIIGSVLAGMISVIKQGEVNNALLQIATSNDLWVNAVIMVICAPIAEELLFRKLLIDRTIQFGERFCIVLSGLIFGLYHGNIYQFFYAFTLGCVFAYVYVKTGNVVYTMILHAMINFIGSIVSVLVIKASGLTDLIGGSVTEPAEMTEYMINHLSGLAIFGLYFLVVLAIVIAGIILFVIRAKKISFAPAAEPIEKGKAFQTVACNIGMGLFFIFWIGYIIFMTVY